MKKFKILTVALFLTGLALTVAAGQKTGRKPTAYRYHYYGRVTYSSPDGTTAYGRGFSLIRREVRPSAGKIIETAVQSGRGPDEKAEEYVTELSRKGSTTVFEAKEEGGTFTGTVSFKGAEWKWRSWVYDLDLTSGGKLTGSGSLNERGVKTRKILSGGDGPDTLIIEDLKPVSLKQYGRLYKKMTAQKDPV